MLVITCESCNTKFRLDPTRLKGRKSKVRCTRCGSVFQIPDQEDDDKVVINLDSSDDTLFEDDAPDFTPPPQPVVQPERRKTNWVRPVVLLLCALIAVTGIFMLGRKVLLSKPSSSNGELTSKAADPPITIPSTPQAYFLENSHVGQIFVVEGEIVNEGAKAVSFVLLEGKLYTINNQTAQAQKSFCGNIMTRDELSSLGIVDIQNRMMNREGKNMSNVHIVPKGRIPFMVVFHNLPEFDQLSDYSVEVKSSQVD